MALRNILTSEEKLLHKHCREVTSFDDRLHTLLDDMRDTLMQADGVGLAAPQVGVLRRAVLVLETNVPEGEQPYVIELINPEIIESSGEQYGLVKRPMEVTVRAQDRDGKTFEAKGEGLTARCFCHEIDHLEGVVFTSRADRMLTDEELESGSWMEEENGEDEVE